MASTPGHWFWLHAAQMVRGGDVLKQEQGVFVCTYVYVCVYVYLMYHCCYSSAHNLHNTSCTTTPPQPPKHNTQTLKVQRRARAPIQVPEFTTGPVLLYDAVQLWKQAFEQNSVVELDTMPLPVSSSNPMPVLILPPEQVHPIDWVDRPGECIPGGSKWNTTECKAMYPDAYCITYCMYDGGGTGWDDDDGGWVHKADVHTIVQ